MCGCAWNMKVVRVWLYVCTCVAIERLCLGHEGSTCVAIRVYVCVRVWLEKGYGLGHEGSTCVAIERLFLGHEGSTCVAIRVYVCVRVWL